MAARGPRAAIVLVVAALALGLPASAASAAEAVGCSGEVVSLTSDGTELDRAAAPGPGGTADDPFTIDPQGTVDWKGKTDEVITNASWSVTIMGLPVLKGTYDNTDGKTSNAGTTDLSTLPAPVSWFLKGNVVIPVSGSITGTGGTCSGSGYIGGTGSPTSSPLFYAGVLFVAVGAVLAVWTVAGTGAAGKVS